MLYYILMTRTQNPGLMNMTRESPSLRGTRKACFWHRFGNRAHSARDGQGQQPRLVPCRPLVPIQMIAQLTSTSSAPLRARPLARIMDRRAARTDQRHEEPTP